jgi:uncharacterized protein (DUF1501 family)
MAMPGSTSPKRTSRRSVLKTGAQALTLAGLSGGFVLRGQDTATLDRAVVCIYLYGGKDQMLAPLVSPSDSTGAAAQSTSLQIAGTTGDPFGLDPSLVELSGLFASKAAAFVLNSALPLSSDSGLAFFPNGFAAPAWAAALAGVTPDNQANLITGLPEDSGVTVLTPGAFNSESDPGRDSLRAAAQSQQFADHFPDTGLGRRLSQITSLLQAASDVGIQKPLVFCGLSARATQPQTWSELSSGLAAFHQMTVDLGISQKITTYTTSPNAGGQRAVVGGSVAGGEIYGQSGGVVRNQFEATLAAWYGVPSGALGDYFPGPGGDPTARLPFLL